METGVQSLGNPGFQPLGSVPAQFGLPGHPVGQVGAQKPIIFLS